MDFAGFRKKSFLSTSLNPMDFTGFGHKPLIADTSFDKFQAIICQFSFGFYRAMHYA